jgi:YbgC/YbaW family acyl-CoA thioester hydrolase
MADRFPYRHRLTVRFRDCDSMGHANHAVYFTYMEESRLTFWKKLTGQARPPETRVILAHAECDYRSPALFGEELEVRMAIGDIGTSSFVQLYEIVKTADDSRVADGRTVMVCYDYQFAKSIPIPAPTRAELERLKA